MEILGSALTIRSSAMTRGSGLSGSSVQGHLSMSAGLEHLFLFCQQSPFPGAPPIPVVTVCHEMVGKIGVAAYSQEQSLGLGHVVQAESLPCPFLSLLTVRVWGSCKALTVLPSPFSQIEKHICAAHRVRDSRPGDSVGPDSSSPPDGCGDQYSDTPEVWFSLWFSHWEGWL